MFLVGFSLFEDDPPQEQLHIHFRKYSGDGDNMKAALEKATCSGGGWTSFHTHGCGSGKAKFFRGFPKVFSEVAEARVGWAGNACVQLLL